jgi:hypothetical protein
MASIFKKQKRLKPGQLVTVAERRFDDAKALCETGKNAHANGAQYLCGFVIEMLLKAHLIRRYASTASKLAHEPMSPEQREVWSLIYRSHDLDEMLNRLPELEAALEKRGERAGKLYREWLRGICGTWTIYARYSPMSTEMAEALELLERVRELKEALK